MSLRARLVLLVLGLTTVLLGGLGFALAGSLSRWTEEVVDAELQRRAQALQRELHVEHGELELEEEDHLPSGSPLRLERPGGAVLLERGAWPTALPGGLGATTLALASGEPVRVLSVSFVPRGADAPLVLRVAAPLGTVSGVADRFRAGLLLALLLAAVLSAGGAALLARTFLAPLQRLSRDVDGLDPSALTGRLDASGLDPELTRLARAFNGLLDHIAAGVERQRAFVGRASHALRTPLASLLAQGEVALRRDRSATEYRAALEAIVATTRDAAALTEALLALSRADAATAEAAKEPVDLRALAHELERLFRPRAELAGLALEVSVPEGLVLEASRPRLREALDAVLDNAVRYTPRGGRVTVSARAHDGGVALDVEDTGPGFAPTERAQVFERFFRGAAAEQTGQPGSGLGLSVVKALVEADGGRAELSDAPGGGARVTLTFPRR